MGGPPASGGSSGGLKAQRRCTSARMRLSFSRRPIQVDGRQEAGATVHGFLSAWSCSRRGAGHGESRHSAVRWQSVPLGPPRRTGGGSPFSLTEQERVGGLVSWKSSGVDFGDPDSSPDGVEFRRKVVPLQIYPESPGDLPQMLVLTTGEQVILQQRLRIPHEDVIVERGDLFRPEVAAC
jgi:hypothetical protein